MARHHGREGTDDLLVELERGMASDQIAEAEQYFESLVVRSQQNSQRLVTVTTHTGNQRRST